MNWQLRTQMLLGSEAVDKLGKAHVAVFGLGGVGSFAAEALARAGVGKLTLIDQDTVSETNINRQLFALRSTIGQAKAVTAAERVLDINPKCLVTPIIGRYEGHSREEFFKDRYDAVVDAIDLVACKLDLIETALSRDIYIISALGTGNKLNPSLFRVTDISKTNYCPLAKVMRKELRKRGILHTRVLWSPEEHIEPLDLEAPPPGRRSVPASASWVPGCAGMMMAGDVILRLTDHGIIY